MRQSANRATYISCALGLAGLTLNTCFHGSLLQPGIVLFFIAAIAFGLEGALLAVVFGALPMALISDELLSALRLAILPILIGLWKEKGFRRPAIMIVGGAWMTTILLCSVVAAITPAFYEVFHSESTRSSLLALQLNDLLAITAACSFLASDFGWYAIARRSRMLSFTNYLILLITGTALGTLAFGLVPVWAYVGEGVTYWINFSLATLAAIVPTLALAASKQISSIQDDSTHAQLSMTAEKDRGFSGHSAMFWRRKELTAALDRSSSDSQLQIPTSQKPGFGPEYGVCVLDGTGAVTLANRRFTKLVGSAEREYCGKPFTGWVMTPEISKTFVELVMLPSPLKRTREVRLADKKSDRFYELSVLPSSLAPGSLQGEPGTKVLTIREVTDTRAIEKSLLQSQKLASLGSVISSIGHAFNSALTTIVGRASHARIVDDPKAMVAGLTEIIAEAQRAGTFVNKLLDFANDAPNAKSHFDAREFINERRELFKNVIGTEFPLDIILPERTLGVSCDPGLLTQAITNLLLNAREAMHERSGKVTLSLGVETIDPDIALLNASAYPGTFVRIRLTDVGHGMSPEVLTHACEPTFTTRSTSGHAGLGLPTAFAIARAHDGFLTLESTPDRGTSISIYLPEIPLTHTANAPASADIPAQKSDSSNFAPRILVVEDEATVRELVSNMLEALGAKVVSCEKPVEALELAQKDPFDIALVDLVMPTMGGNEWVTNLRALSKGQNATIPVVLMTGHGANATCNKSIHSILPKPFTMDDLKHVLELAGKQK